MSACGRESFLHNCAKECNEKRDKGFEMCDVRSLYRAGSLTATRKLARLDLVGVQIRCDKGGTDYTSIQIIIIFSMEKETKIINWEQDFLYTTE
jgi:hypothetical protein